MTDADQIVGFAELSATAVRARLLDAHDRFWATDTRPLHHPVWFHQFGGFGALAMSATGEDVSRCGSTSWRRASRAPRRGSTN